MPAEKRAKIASAKQARRVTETATFGAGCFWGVQKLFSDQFEKNGAQKAIIDTQVGFMSADDSAHMDEDPSYE